MPRDFLVSGSQLRYVGTGKNTQKINCQALLMTVSYGGLATKSQ